MTAPLKASNVADVRLKVNGSFNKRLAKITMNMVDV